MTTYFKQVSYIVQCNGVNMSWRDPYLSFANEPFEFQTVEQAIDAVKSSIVHARGKGYESSWAICFGAVSIVPVEPKFPNWKMEL